MFETEYRRKQARRVADRLVSGFVWSSTPEGSAYWVEVHDKLAALGGWDPVTGTWVDAEDGDRTPLMK